MDWTAHPRAQPSNRINNFMKVTLVFILLTLLLACNNAAPVTNSTKPINAAQQTNEAQSVLAHTSEGQPPKPMNADSSGGKRSQSGDPIDTAKFDTAIASAEKELKAKPSDETLKKGLAQAFFERGVALTEARQYASALGDYRRALKLDPDHEESKEWIDQIIGIYTMMKKAAPKEGDEPPPLPFKKQA